MDDRHVVYGVATPRSHRPVCVSCGQKPFTNFLVQVYMRDYQHRSASITVSQPHLLFNGPRGAQIRLDVLIGGWLVYDTRPLQERWQLFARNVVNGRSILLDSSRTEGRHSIFDHASSDGNTVVWQSSSQIFGSTTLGFWSYTLATGHRQLLPPGGTDAQYLYTTPEIWGNHLIMGKQSKSRPTSQLFIENLTTRHVLALTPAGQWNFEASISGDFVVWVRGLTNLGQTHGLVVANLVTGRRVALKHSSSQLPHIAAGRYVVFAPDYPTPYPSGSVQVYDVLTGHQRAIVTGPDASGFVPNLTVEAAGSTALVRMDKQVCDPTNHGCPTHFTLISLEPA